MKTITKLNLFLAVLLLPVSVWAAMSSTNYYIYADSVETGGGLSTGGAYDLEDTMGEGIITQSGSPTYIINAGYQAMVLGSLSMNISNNSLNLGTLSTTSVSFASTTVTISTDAATGYTLSIMGVSGSVGLAPANSSSPVTAGVEGYGISAIGLDSAFNWDEEVKNGLVLASNSGPVIGRQTELVFKAAISPTTPPGNRSQTVSIGVSANF